MNNSADLNQIIYNDAANALLIPISPDHPAGEDLSLSILFDEIRDARRSDDAGLTQGLWQTDIKIADWKGVRDLCESAMITRTKDLQLAAWYIEARIHLDGFHGLVTGLEVFHGLLETFWTSCFPLIEDDDLDERAGKIEWLNTQLPIALKQIPMTDRDNQGYTWLQWQESRWVESLGHKDAEAKAQALADGKLAGELFDKAAAHTSRSFSEPLLHDSQRAVVVLDALIHTVDTRFGQDAPSLINLRQTLHDCALLVDRLYGSGTTDNHQSRSRVQTDSPMAAVTLEEPMTAKGSVAVKTVGALNNRGDAIQALRDVAQYFRVNEPQSPVALLAARAARWAEMSMDEWLAAVVKDDSTLAQLRELLDISPAS